jgi:hypothetical protein
MSDKTQARHLLDYIVAGLETIHATEDVVSFGTTEDNDSEESEVLVIIHEDIPAEEEDTIAIRGGRSFRVTVEEL